MAHPLRRTAGSHAVRLAAACGCTLALGLLALALSSCNRPPAATGNDVLVHVDRIVIDRDDTPVVVLEEENGPRWLPIWIGPAEAHSIALQIERRSSPRPNSHDLTRELIHGLDGSVERVVVTELRDGTYYAVLDILHGDQRLELDARPSDAIAIGLRDGAPIFVRDDLFLQSDGLDPDEPTSPRREI
ncbi:MAG TPA: bifunctional nuclease family protein [Gaiellaceae bacterium]|nr:bifunctional nuclease family protein [Gaiellaceae bacterium]